MQPPRRPGSAPPVLIGDLDRIALPRVVVRTLPHNLHHETAPHIDFRNSLARATTHRSNVEEHYRSMEELRRLAVSRGRIELVPRLQAELDRLEHDLKSARRAEELAMLLVREGGGSARPPQLLSPDLPPINNLFPSQPPLHLPPVVAVTELRHVPGHVIVEDFGIVYAAASNRERVHGGSPAQLHRLKERLRAAARAKGNAHAVIGVVLSYDQRDWTVAASGNAVRCVKEENPYQYRSLF